MNPNVATTRVLIISTEGDGVQDDMIAPLVAARRRLRTADGLDLRRVRADGAEAVGAALAAHPCDVLLLATSWRRGAEETIDLCRGIHERPDRPRVIYLDSFDSTSKPYLGILPYVDRYVKKQLLRDVHGYDGPLAGGYVFTDHLQRERGWDLDGWHFGSNVPDELHDRLALGWNIGATPRLQRRLRSGRLLTRALARRTVDVFCRVALRSTDGADWYSRHRLEGLAILERLGVDRRVVAHGGIPGTGELIRPRVYRREMAASRIAFSPFGWGEICYRDFEATCAGCLLVKPSVEHLRTEPDVFRPHETYVPVRWDLGDLEATCRHYLDHLDEAQRIVDAARAAYAAYFRERRLLATAKGLIAGS
jgi:hypothetical protein